MQPKPTALKVLDIASIIVLAISTYLALFFAPTELVMGDVQRVFYFHIGTAWVGLLGFIIAAGSGIIYLITKDLPQYIHQHPALKMHQNSATVYGR